MHVYITARHFDLTESIRQYVLARIVQPVERHARAQDLNRIEVQLTSSGQGDAAFGCHVWLQLTGHRDINITEQNHDLRAAIDLAERRLMPALAALRESQLVKKRHPRSSAGAR
jgi:ribosomal subunit interface protein